MRKSNVFMLGATVVALGTVAAFAIGFKLPQVALDENSGAGSISVINEYIPVVPGTRIEIDNMAGDVRIEPVDGDTVHVAGTLGDNVLPLVIEYGDGSVMIRTVRVDQGAFKIHTRKKNDARLVVKVPAGHPLQVHTVSADQNINGYTGPRIECESVNGDIRCDGVAGTVRIKTVNGGVVRSGKAQRIRIASTNGDVHVYNETDGEYDIKTVSGNLVLHGGLPLGGMLDVETVSGNARVYLPAELTGRFRLASTSGEIVYRLEGQSAEQRVTSVNGRIVHVRGSADRDVTVKTASGNIWIGRVVLKKDRVGGANVSS